MNAETMALGLQDSLSGIFECSKTPNGSVRVRTLLTHPDGDLVDLFLIPRDDGTVVVTDYGDTHRLAPNAVRQGPHQWPDQEDNPGVPEPERGEGAGPDHGDRSGLPDARRSGCQGRAGCGPDFAHRVQVDAPKPERTTGPPSARETAPPLIRRVRQYRIESLTTEDKNVKDHQQSRPTGTGRNRPRDALHARRDRRHAV